MDAFFLNICKIFGNGTKIIRGKVHEYLGMDMDWFQEGTMIISMIKYSQKSLIISQKWYAVIPPRMSQNTCLR